MKTKTNLLKDIALYTGFAVAGLLIVFIVMLSAFPEVSLNTIGINAYVAKYDTMEPTINPYDLVFINRVDIDDLEVGDLVTFEADINYDGNLDLVTYYVHSIGGTVEDPVVYVIAEGASLPLSTVGLHEESILGGYSFKLSKFGYVTEFLSSGFGIAAVLVNAGIITVIVILVKGNKKEENQEKNIEA